MFAFSAGISNMEICFPPQEIGIWSHHFCSLAFAFVAGVPPLVGLHAAVVMGAVAAAFGAQPGVISGTAGATAVVWAPLVVSHGVE